MKILMAGGGTGGSVAPLLAVYEEIKKQNIKAEFFWIGTRGGLEKQLIDRETDICFNAISSGKLRRYFSWQNFLDIFRILLGLTQSFFYIQRIKPDVVVSAGSYVAVPVVWAASCLGVPALIHQQDLRVGLANKLMAPVATIITTTFEESKKNFLASKAVWTGNPVRQVFDSPSFISKNDVLKKYRLDINKPLILIIGGGIGALAVNEVIWGTLSELVKYFNIIHVVGRGKMKATKADQGPSYRQFEFLNEELAEIMQASDLIVTRGGMGILSEIARLKKPAVVIPLPESHQLDNVAFFVQHQAIEVIKQQNLSGGVLINKLRELMNNPILSNQLAKNIALLMRQDGAANIVRIIFSIAKK